MRCSKLRFLFQDL